MSKAMKITDHAFFGGSGSPRFPESNKVKEFTSANGEGGELDYEDKTEDIKKQQELSNAKIRSLPMKPNCRN